MSVETDKKFLDTESTLLKDHIKNLLDEIYIVCRSIGRDCSQCIFNDEVKIKWETGYEKDQYVEMCPINVALLEWKSSIGRGNRIHPWILEHLDTLPEKLAELSQED